jgi:hypothetical protein
MHGNITMKSLVWFFSFSLYRWLLSVYWECISFFLFHYWGLNSGPYTLTHSTSPFLYIFFWDRVSWAICQGWLQTAILLISAFWVARITGVSHQCPAEVYFFYFFNTLKIFSFTRIFIIQGGFIVTIESVFLKQQQKKDWREH